MVIGLLIGALSDSGPYLPRDLSSASDLLSLHSNTLLSPSSRSERLTAGVEARLVAQDLLISPRSSSRRGSLLVVAELEEDGLVISVGPWFSVKLLVEVSKDGLGGKEWNSEELGIFPGLQLAADSTLEMEELSDILVNVSPRPRRVKSEDRFCKEVNSSASMLN